jgi:hypothetical protein
MCTSSARDQRLLLSAARSELPLDCTSVHVKWTEFRQSFFETGTMFRQSVILLL